MTIILTGGAGFIGSAFLAKLNSQGITDIILVDNLASSQKWKNLRGKRFEDYVHKDEFLKRVEADRAPTNVSCIVHLGACSSTTERDVNYLMHNNYYYSKALTEWALKIGARFVYASSAATYGDGSLGYSDDHSKIASLQPLNPYGFSKNLFDTWALDHGHLERIAGVRFFNVFGPNEYHKEEMRSVVHKAWQQIRATGSVRLFKSDRPDYKDGEQKRDFIYVKDCSEVLWRLCQNHHTNGVFNLGTGTSRTWVDLAKSVFTALKIQPKIQFIDMPTELKGKYQYFTEAEMQKLSKTPCSIPFTSLESGVEDYVLNYLEKGESHL